MEIDTGDNPPVSQRPYSLALKHVDWVRQELEALEKAGVITRSVSPRASPIVIVPKKAAPGEPPKRRMCVDYRALNSLLPPVTKANSKAKGVLTLVPLHKIDEIHAALKGSVVYSTFDMRSGYYHIELTPASKEKSAFMVGGPYAGKYQCGQSQDTVPIASTQAAIKGIVQYSMSAQLALALSQSGAPTQCSQFRRACRVACRLVTTSCTHVSAINIPNFIQCIRCVQT